MQILPLREDLFMYLQKKHNPTKKWLKVETLLASNLKHPSLNVELLEPKHRGIFSFRIDKKYRALFFVKDGYVEIFAITNHYK